MKLWIAIVVLMFATVGHAGKADASGYFYTGSKLLEVCESDSDYPYCRGYLMGMHDLAVTYDKWGYIAKEFCIPDKVGTGQLEKVVIKGLNDNPEHLHRGAASIVAVIFREAFPCD